MDNLGDCSKPIVCLGVTYALVYTCGCGGGRIGPTRCAVIAAARDDRWRTRQASRTSPAAARSAHSALAAESRLAAPLPAGRVPQDVADACQRHLRKAARDGTMPPPVIRATAPELASPQGTCPAPRRARRSQRLRRQGRTLRKLAELGEGLLLQLPDTLPAQAEHVPNLLEALRLARF